MKQLFIQIFLGLLTSIIGFLVGRANNKLNLKREVQKERFENLYIPFVRLYDKTHMAAAYNFEHFEEAIQKEYMEILVNNMVYANEFTREYIIQFMMLYNMIYIQNEVDEEEIENLNKTFNSICHLIYEEYLYIQNKLYYSFVEKMRNRSIKRKYRRYAKDESVQNAFMNNL